MTYQPWGFEVKWDCNVVFVRGSLLGTKESFKAIVAHYKQNHTEPTSLDFPSINTRFTPWAGNLGVKRWTGEDPQCCGFS